MALIKVSKGYYKYNGARATGPLSYGIEVICSVNHQISTEKQITDLECYDAEFKSFLIWIRHRQWDYSNLSLMPFDYNASHDDQENLSDSLVYYQYSRNVCYVPLVI